MGRGNLLIFMLAREYVFVMKSFDALCAISQKRDCIQEYNHLSEMLTLHCRYTQTDRIQFITKDRP